MHSLPNKKEIFKKLLALVEEKIASIESAILQLQESIKNETKSTSGDKYETSRAMLHIEQENIMHQLANAIHQKKELQNIQQDVISPTIKQGSLIATNNGIFYISTALGKIIINDKQVITLSPQSPLGRQFIDKIKGDTVEFNQMKYIIDQIN